MVINSFWSIVTLLYLSVYRPFKDGITNFINIATEVIITFMFFVCGGFLLRLDDSWKEVLSIVMMASSGAIVLVIIFSLILKLGAAVCKNVMRRKNRRIVPEIVFKEEATRTNDLFGVQNINDYSVNRAMDVHSGPSSSSLTQNYEKAILN